MTNNENIYERNINPNSTENDVPETKMELHLRCWRLSCSNPYRRCPSTVRNQQFLSHLCLSAADSGRPNPCEQPAIIIHNIKCYSP